MPLTCSAICPTLSYNKYYYNLLFFITLLFSLHDPSTIHRKQDSSVAYYASRTITVLAWQMSDCVDRSPRHRQRMVARGFFKDSLWKVQQRVHFNYGFRLHSQMPHQQDHASVIDAYDASVTGGCVKNTTNHIRLLDKSLKKSSGKGIFERINDILSMESSSSQGDYYNRNITTAEDLHKNLRFGILSHGIQADPIYNYGNAASLSLFEQTIENLCQTPSRYSTVPELMDDRAKVLDQIEKVGHGFIYNAVRTSTTGKLFVIQEILFWPVYDDYDKKIGAAAIYDREKCLPYVSSTTNQASK